MVSNLKAFLTFFSSKNSLSVGVHSEKSILFLPMIAFIPVVKMPETSYRICLTGSRLMHGREQLFVLELVPVPPTK